MKKLCDLLEIQANNEACVVFKFKDSTTRMDLISLGCFRGDEEMIRMTKGRQPEITLYYADGKTSRYHFGEGSTTVLNDSGMRQREMIRECAILDFGLVCDWSYMGPDSTYKELVRRTMGVLSPEDAERAVEIASGGGMFGHIRVNGQTVAHDVHVRNMGQWFKDRGYELELNQPIQDGLPCGVVHGTCMPMDTEKELAPEPVVYQDGELKVRLPHGYLVATVCGDPDYPGIDVEFVSDRDNGEVLSRPRVLVEMPFGPERDSSVDVRALVWNDPHSEDYTDEIRFDHTSVRAFGAPQKTVDGLLTDADERRPDDGKGGDGKAGPEHSL